MQEGGQYTEMREDSRQEEGMAVDKKDGRQWTGRSEYRSLKGGRTADRKEGGE